MLSGKSKPIKISASSLTVHFLLNRLNRAGCIEKLTMTASPSGGDVSRKKMLSGKSKANKIGLSSLTGQFCLTGLTAAKQARPSKPSQIRKASQPSKQS